MKRVTIEGHRGDNIFVKIPAMWFRIGTDNNNNITDIAVSKVKGDGDNWYQTKEFYYSAYLGNIDGGYCISAPNNVINDDGGEYITDVQRNIMKRSKSNTDSFEENFYLLDIYHKTIINFLFLIEFAEKDSQSLFPMTFDTVLNTGGTDTITTPSGTLENGRMKWRNIEDLFGNAYEWVDGVIYNGAGGFKVCYNLDDMSDQSKYGNLGYSLSNTVSFGAIKSLGWDSLRPFICLPKLNDGADTSRDDTPIQYFDDSAYFGKFAESTTNIISGDSMFSYMGREGGIFMFTKRFDDSVVGKRMIYCPNGV